MKIMNDADLLAFIPYAMDREPKNMMAFFLEMEDGKHAVTAFHLPDGPDPAFIKSIVSVMKSSEAVAAVGVLYTDDQGCEDGHPPRADVSAIVIATIVALCPNVDLKEMLTVGPECWWNLEDAEVQRSLDEIENSVLNAELIAAGHTYRRGELVIPEPTAAGISRTLRIDMLYAKIPEGLGNFAYTKGDKHFAQARALLSTVMAQSHGPSESQAEQLIAYFQHRGIRERLIGDIMNAPEEIDKYALHIGGLGEEPFSVSRYTAGIALITNLLQYALGEHRANLLVAFAWIKWLVGDSEYVKTYLAAAEGLTPDLAMTEFLKERMSEGGLPPSAKVRPLP